MNEEHMLSLTEHTGDREYQRLADKLDQFLSENPSARPFLRHYIESILSRCRQQSIDNNTDTPE